MPSMVRRMFAAWCFWRLAMIFASLSGIASITAVRPDGPGPSTIENRSRVEPASGMSSNLHWAEGSSASPAFQANTRFSS